MTGLPPLDGEGGPAAGPEAPVELVRYTADVVVPCERPGLVVRPGVVEVSGDTVTHVGAAGSEASGSGVREVRVEGALLPGLVNVHCHSPMTLFRGTGENLPLHRWLHEVLWRRLSPRSGETMQSLRVKR